MNSQQILLSEGAKQYLFQNWLVNVGLSTAYTYRKVLFVSTSKKEFYEYLDSIKDSVNSAHLPYNCGAIYFGSSFTMYDVSSDSIELEMFGETEELDELEAAFSKKFAKADSYVDWIYSVHGECMTVPILDDRKPSLDSYPFLEASSLEEYYDSFIHSNSNILVLVGPPGTGKTTFIRGLIQHWKTTALVAYDMELLNKDGAFVSFLEGEANLMILEDADTFITSREETGNTMMHRFLNLGDGLVSNPSKKLVFSTNITDLSTVDSALIRPGRCFDIVKFRNLSIKEAKRVCPSFESDKDEVSLAEVYQYMNSGSRVTDAKKRGTRQKVGFI